MIDELKDLIDACENRPKAKEIFLKVAELPEDKQKATIELIRLMAKEMEER